MRTRWLIAALVTCGLLGAAGSRAQAPESQIINRADVQFVSGSQSNFFTSEPVITIFQRVRDPTFLFLQKIASRQTAEIGDFLDYTLQVRNVATNGFNVVTIDDVLPFGFLYEKGSTRYEGARVADPAGGAGPKLQFTVGPLDANETATLSYRVRIGPGAALGVNRNTAQASTAASALATAPGARRRFSNVASATVEVGGGVFTDRGIVLGKVFLDANTNRTQDAGELGIPGVRIWLEDGTYAITDSEGKYSLYGLRPIMHVLKVDNITLPRGAKLLPLSNRNAGHGGTRFLDIYRGQMQKADFAIGPVNDELLADVTERRAKAETTPQEANNGIKSQLTPDGAPISRGDPRGLPATGTVGPALNSGPSANLFSGLKPPPLDSRNSNLPTPKPPPSPLPAMPSEQTLTNLDNTPGFVDLKNGDTLPMAQATIRVKGPTGSAFNLKVNGQPVPDHRIGQRLTVPSRQMDLVEYVGVELRPGTNAVALEINDAFGNPRFKNGTIHVVAPDTLGQIKIVLPSRDQSADGQTPAVITVRLEDVNGVPVTTRTPITLETSLGEWKVTDLDKAEPGVQVFIEGGHAEFQLAPPIEPGDATIHASSGTIKAEAVLPFLPDLRPLVGVGLIEGRVRLSSLSSGSILPARSRDGFEEELRSFAATDNDGRMYSAGRAAFFLKGKIKGEYLLTAGFDSEKETRERLFRDIQPDEFYPVYGDSAVKGYDAQSTDRLYVRIDKNKCYLLYGDYLTSSQTEARGLGNYSRSLNGIKEHYEKERFVANLWATHDTMRQVIEELPANGTSGPYMFRTANGIVNSEKVEIITRDRDQRAVILKAVPMSRFTDYEFEPFTGRILFRAPVPSLDENLNPISIRVTYEVDQGGDSFWVYGADAQGKVTKWLELGGAAVRDENPLGDYGLYSANTTVKLAPNSYIIGEVAHSQGEFTDGGTAGRVELRHQDQKTDARIYWGRAENTFSNNASILSPGRTESGAKVARKITPNTRLVGQALHTESIADNGERKGGRLDLEHTFTNQVRVEVGGRYSTETRNPASITTVGVTPNEVTSVRAKVTTPVPKVKGATAYAEYENDVVEPDKRLAAVGGEYQLRPKTRLYARHEFVNALGSPFELNTVQQQHTTLIGLDTEYMKNASLFNEYRMRDAISGRESEAATGLRNLWNLSEGLRLNTTFERISPVHGDLRTEATAGTAAIEYTRNPDWKATARLELRASDPNNSLLNTLGYARKLNQDWTFLGRTIVYLVDNKGDAIGNKSQARFQAGFAWRQTLTNAWNGLWKYEYKIEEDASVPALDLNRQVHILTFDLNYQPHPDWQLSGHYGGKIAFEHFNGNDGTSDAHLIALRGTYDINSKWDVGLVGSVLFSGEASGVQFGFGPEVGYTLRDSVRLALGYNVFGFRDRDLSSEEYTDHGVYVTFRLKFDETLMGLRKGGTP